MVGKCAGCAFWDERKCRRFPPHATFPKHEGFYDHEDTTWWPFTSPNDWCGEWKPKPQPAEPHEVFGGDDE